MQDMSQNEVESLASRMIVKYPDGYLSEPELVMWEGWAVAIRGPDVDGLDSPKAIIRGSYVEIRAFEVVYHRIKGKSFPLRHGGWQGRYGGLDRLQRDVAKH